MLRVFSAIFWILFGFFLTPIVFFVMLGFYVWPEMIVHTYKFAVCYALFYFMLVYEASPIWNRRYEWAENYVDREIRKVVKNVARNRS